MMYATTAAARRHRRSAATSTATRADNRLIAAVGHDRAATAAGLEVIVVVHEAAITVITATLVTRTTGNSQHYHEGHYTPPGTAHPFFLRTPTVDPNLARTRNALALVQLSDGGLGELYRFYRLYRRRQGAIPAEKPACHPSQRSVSYALYREFFRSENQASLDKRPGAYSDGTKRCPAAIASAPTKQTG